MSQNCYRSSAKNRGVIKKEDAEEQDERLTRKHVQTLSFVQEVVSENKTLKEKLADLEQHVAGCAELHNLALNSQERIKQIQEDFHNRSDEINQLLTEKHKQELVRKEEERLLQEKKHEEQQRKLHDELERVKQLNEQLVVTAAEAVKYKTIIEDNKLHMVKQKDTIHFLEAEIQRHKLEAENQIFELRQMKELEKERSELQHKLQEFRQTSKELDYRARQLEKEVGESGVRDENDTLDFLKNQLKQLLKEKDAWELERRTLLGDLSDLRAENTHFRTALADSERMRGEQRDEVLQLRAELTKLKKEGKSDERTFREFINIKRELTALRTENEELKLRLKSGSRRRETISSVLKPEQVQRPNSRKASDYPHALYSQK